MYSIAFAGDAALVIVVVLIVGMWNAVGEQDAAERNEVEPERCKQGVQSSVDLTQEPPPPRQLRWVHINVLWPRFGCLCSFLCSAGHSISMLLLR